jgi:hypothetical protein
MSTFEPPPSEAALQDLLATSEEKADGGELVGRDPREVPLSVLSRSKRAIETQNQLGAYLDTSRI